MPAMGMAEAAVRGMSMQSLAGHSQGLHGAVAGPPFWSMGISIRGPFSAVIKRAVLEVL